MIQSRSNFSDLAEQNVCIRILLTSVSHTRIKYYDICLLVASFFFLLFLMLHCRVLRRNLSSTNSVIIHTIYILLCVACALKVARVVLAIGIKFEGSFISVADKVLWLVVRFFLLSIEISIIVFGIGTASLTGRSSIQRVLIVTSLISLTYTCIQAALELTNPDPNFFIPSKNYTIYGHGGALFFSISSFIFLAVYGLILMLPLTPTARWTRLPTKKVFYIYCGILACLYCAEAVGSLLMCLSIVDGLCVLEVTTFVYFAFYDPLVYVTFLRAYFQSLKISRLKPREFSIQSEGSRSLSKSYSVATVSTNYNYRSRSRVAMDKERSLDQKDSDLEQQATEHSLHFYPDNMITLDCNGNIAQLAEDYHIMPEGAWLDFTGGRSSSALDSEGTLDEAPSRISSINADPTKKNSWNLDDFASA